jgi:F-type H+-transporting ATPase subunit b
MFDSAATEYRAKVEEAAKVLEEARKVQADWAARAAKIDEEAARIKADALHLAEAQAQELIAGARQTAERIIKDAEQTAAAELLRARDDLRAELAAKVLALAEEKLQGRLTPSHHHLLIDEAIKKLEASQ